MVRMSVSTTRIEGDHHLRPDLTDQGHDLSHHLFLSGLLQGPGVEIVL
jgi:hypothetical protein